MIYIYIYLKIYLYAKTYLHGVDLVDFFLDVFDKVDVCILFFCRWKFHLGVFLMGNKLGGPQKQPKQPKLWGTTHITFFGETTKPPQNPNKGTR